ncbi:MAG: O-antigen ligase family protein [Ruminococcaceae bacterium]|nr:O-antigen ligase family protein [Oscillospiraceae bacterium]
MMKTVIRKYGADIFRVGLSLFVFLAAVLTGGETERIAPIAVALICVLCVGLFLLRSTKYLTLLFLQLSLLLIFCYDSFSVFVRYIWLLPVVLLGMTVYLMRKKPRFSWGASALSLVAVSVATLLGGVGMISFADYFRPASLAFMAGLGPGLIFSYWIVKNELKTGEDRDAFMRDLLYWGMTAAAIVFWYMVPFVIEVGSIFSYEVPQWSNNISTMLMIALPAALAQKNRGFRHYLLLFFMFAATLLAGSRGGQLLVGIELVACCLWAWLQEENRVKKICSGVCFICICAVAAGLLILLYYNPDIVNFTGKDEVRWKLFARGLENFRENPLFGSGLGYRGNADLFSGKQGTINWYHIFISQVVGGLGIAGILAWGYQLYTRACLSRRVWRTTDFGFALCYFGLLLMSMVNPGEFCPVPYAFLAVCFFAAIENRIEEQGVLPLRRLYMPWRK